MKSKRWVRVAVPVLVTIAVLFVLLRAVHLDELARSRPLPSSRRAPSATGCCWVTEGRAGCGPSWR